MSAPWIRRPPEGRETGAALVLAGIAAVGVGAGTFYLTRLLLAREPLGGRGLPVATQGGGGADQDTAAAGVGGA